MVFDQIKTGIIPFGGGVGIRALYVKITQDDYTKEFENVEEKALYMINEIKRERPEEFQQALKSQLQFCFVGNGLEDKDQSALNEALFTQLSRESLELQKADQLKVQQMRPPFFVWVGKPLVYTGNRQFYEQFNYIVATCPTKTPNGEVLTKENMDKGYSLTALVEIANHNFSQFVFKIDNEEELKVIIDVYLANSIPVNGDRIIIIPGDVNNKELLTACYDFAEKHRIRLGVNYKLIFDNALDFDIF